MNASCLESDSLAEQVQSLLSAVDRLQAEVVDLPEDSKVCDCCGKPLADLGVTDASEQIEIETTVYRQVVRRKRYRQTCDCSGRPRTVTASLPPKLLPKSIYGTSLWIHLLLEKFHLQRPANRTIEQLRLVSLNEHWSGLSLFVDDPRIPMDNNYGERLIRNPAVGRKNYYGSGAEWSGRLAMMLFSIFATLALWKINPLEWLRWYFEACAAAGSKAPDNPASFLPWNLSEARLEELQDSTSKSAPDTS
jgi:hypothetical protein